MAFSPLDITGCRLLLDASAITGLSSSDPVASWADGSGQSNNAGQASSGNRPTYVTGVVNGLPVVRFSASSAQYLDLTANNLTGATAGSLFLVCKLVSDPPSTIATSGPWVGRWTGDTTTSGRSNHTPYTDGIVYENWGTTARKTAGNPTPSLAAWSIYGVRSAAADWSLRINAESQYSTGTNTVGFGSLTPTIGVTYNSSGDPRYLNGDIAEILAFNVALSQSDRESVEGYLAHKWGIASILPIGHPYKSSPPGGGGGGGSIAAIMHHRRMMGVS